MPLSPREIKIRLLEQGLSAAEIARRLSKKLNRPVPRENVSRVINCTPGFSFPEIRRELARIIRVPVAEIGREPSPAQKKRAATINRARAATIAVKPAA